MQFTQLSVLLWKNWILHRRHCVVTLIEIVSPVLFSLVLLYVVPASTLFTRRRSSPTVIYHNRTTYEVFDPVANFSENLLILYAPDTFVAKKLMDTAFLGTNVATAALPSKQDIMDEYKRYKLKMNFWGAAIFYNFNQSTIPAELKYELSVNSLTVGFIDPLEMTYFDEGIEMRLSDNSPYKHGGFLAIQILIDLAYIKIIQENKALASPNIQVKVKRIPIPPFVTINKESSPILVTGISIFISLGYLTFFVFIVKRLVEEKNNRAKEIMKMMGMSPTAYWGSVFISNFILATIIGVVITIIYSVPMNESVAVLHNSSTSLFLVILLVYSASSLLFCFAVSAVFSKATSAMTIIIIFWIATALVGLKSTNSFMESSKDMCFCFIPNIGLNMAIKIALFHGISGEGAQWGNIMKPLIGNQDSFSVGSVLIMMVLSCSLYTILLLYLDAVSPWQPGVPKPPLFFLHKSFWGQSKPIVETEYNGNAQGTLNHFEKEPNDLTPSVVLRQLTKGLKKLIGKDRVNVPSVNYALHGKRSFCNANSLGVIKKYLYLHWKIVVFPVAQVVFGVMNNVKAVDNVSLNIYPGQITSLLGHNGAGKTTTMNIITGIFRPTKGTVTVNGYDIVKETNSARSSLGLCPQHNVLYFDLTVEEHLKLFAGLKGMKWWAMNEEITNLLTKLQLLKKRSSLAKELSGGMQRKLCLANSVIGQSKVLILDEPTTGLDPESRRGVWDLLEELRPGRTILLTTHYMEEADALGDRIAIMASGSIQCCGSSMFLKKIFGAGYKLRIEKGATCRVKDITNLVLRHIPKATVLSDVNLELIYSLSDEVSKFSKLFQDLEESYHSLGIESCGVDITTMDDVFMKVGEIIQEQEEDNQATVVKTKDGGFLFKRPSLETADGKIIPETLQKMEALLIKRARYAKRNLMLLIFQILLPLLFMIFFVSADYIMNSDGPKSTDTFSFDLRHKFEKPKSGVLYTVNKTNDSLALGDHYKRILKKESVEVVDIGSKGGLEEYLLGLNITLQEVNSYAERYLIGATIEQKKDNFSLTAWFNGIHYHLDPMSVNLVNNAILRFVTKDDEGRIHMIASRLREAENDRASVALNPPNFLAQFFSVIFLPIGFAFLSSSFVLFPTYERVSKATFLQRMCGINGAVYWLANLCWDFLVNASSATFLIIPFVICSGSGLISFSGTGGIFLLVLLHGLCSIPLAYVTSFFFDVPTTGFAILLLINILGGIFSTVIISVLLQYMPKSADVLNTLFLLRFFPNFAVSWGIKNVYYSSKESNQCTGYNKKVLREACKSAYHYCCTNSVKDGQGYHELSYFAWKDDAAGKECLALFLSFCFWFGFTILLETNLIEKVGVYIMNRKIIKKKLIPQYEMAWVEENDVSQERQRIENIITRNAFHEESLVANKLTKDFFSLRAVNNLAFGVHKEECFGLLGVNGAGKTTVFRMLTGDLVPSNGNAYTKHANIQNKLGEFQRDLGYCPQFDGHIDRLTAIETLQLFAYLRGVPKSKVNDNVNKIISMCGLQEFANKLTYTYSGGTKRKLSLAMALIGAPPVILLDEPTSGVDPASRRKIWQTLATMKDILGVSFILTSHSMDECEALCNRLAIMVNGEFRCIGSIQKLKSKYGQGYMVITKISESTDVENLKIYIQKSLPSAELKGYFQDTLHYYVTDTSLKWSTMFEIMEIVKEKFHLVDYILTGSKLEQIFLTFSRNQKRQENDASRV